MASGYFPLEHKNDCAGLVKALDEVEKVLREDYRDGVVPEDAATDGEYLAKLRLAANFIHGALDFTKNPACGHDSRKYGRCRAYRHYFGDGVVRLACDGCGIDGHDSDCATHNEPATPNGPCDCSVAQKVKQPIPDVSHGFHIFMDGNAWCAVGPAFRDLQQDSAGFGHTPRAAYEAWWSANERLTNFRAVVHSKPDFSRFTVQQPV